jgi:lysyl endopeptidase
MKTRSSLALSWFYVLMILTINVANGQIRNRIIKPEVAQKHGIEVNRISSLSGYMLPNIDMRQLHKEDSIEKNLGKPFRFGKALDVSIDFMSAATKIRTKDTTLMFYQFTSKNAFSINLIFDKFFLAENASLLIYNTNRSMVYGPIEKTNNPRNGVFWSDLVKGESIILQLTILGEDTKETQIHIEKIIHGYRNTFAGFGQSADCNRDIACPEGNDWRNEGNSVAMLLLDDGTRFCTGSLLNNVCQDLTPNFLTAFHCLDLNQNGVLVEGETDEVNDWVFRFLYESPSCGGGDDAVFQSINGSTFLAAFQPTDFALLLLNSRPTGDVTYAGWSRTNVAATSAVAIHHPAGDVKKISIDNNPLTNIGIVTTWVRDFFGNPVVQCPANTHWNTVFDSPAVGIDPSTVQHGSSGSPIFDQNHRVVGQLHGDHLFTGGNTFCDNVRGDYGRFDVSWGRDNNGNFLPNRDAENSLAPWLDSGITNAMTTNTMVIPTITGSSLIACTGATFTLNNAPAGATVTWVASPGYFQTNSGSGTSASLIPYDLSSGGPGVVTFTVSTACDNFQVQSNNFSVQGLLPSAIYFGNSENEGMYFCSSSYGNYFEIVSGASGTNFEARLLDITGQTVLYTSPTTNYQAGTPNLWSYYPSSDGYYVFEVRGTNECGSTSWVGTEVEYVNCSWLFTVYPNPTDNYLDIEMSDEIVTKTELYQITLVDYTGTEVLKASSKNKKQRIDTSHLKNGQYILRIQYNDEITLRRIVIDRK